MVREIKTDFPLKDSREYVNSPTFIQELQRLLCARVGSGVNWGRFRVDATFHRTVTRNGVYRIEDGSGNPRQDDPPVHLKLYDHRTMFHVGFEETEPGPIQTRVSTDYQVELLQSGADLSGTFRIGCCNGYQFLENVFEANKRLHLKVLAVADRLKVVSLYAKSLPFTLEDDAGPTTSLRIENIRIRQMTGALVTLNRMRFPDLDLGPSELSYIIYRNPK